MPFVLIGIGLSAGWLAYLGMNNLAAAGSLLKQEWFTNQNPFYKWAGAIVLIGLVGYVPQLRKIAVAMLTLVILSIALSHLGPITALERAL